MKKEISNFIRGSIALLMAIAFMSCSETDILSSNEIIPDLGDEIVLQISSPESLTTRGVDDNHVLRYTAKLFSGSFNDQKVTFIERKQGIATNGDGAVLKFSVKPGTYSVLLFADYIPSDFKPDADGFYPDKYYDTTIPSEEINMKSFVNVSGGEPIGYCCINNENYDCFSGVIDNIKKGEEKVEKFEELTRAVAKVRFVSATDEPSTISKIKFSKFDYYDNFTVYGGSVMRNKTVEKLSAYQFDEMSDPSNKEVFFFYTFAPASDTNKNLLQEISFTISFNDKDDYVFTIPNATVKARKNYITTVKGPFLSEYIPEDPEAGDIILHLTSSGAWNNNNWSGSEIEL